MAPMSWQALMNERHVLSCRMFLTDPSWKGSNPPATGKLPVRSLSSFAVNPFSIYRSLVSIAQVVRNHLAQELS